MSTTSDYALAYVARGWHVFPAPADGTKKGLKSKKYSGTNWGCTNDPAQVRNDFARWPNANVGITCGAESGIWVLDIDTFEGHTHDGFASLAHLEAVYGPLPATLTSLSPSGSQHRYYRHPADGTVISNSQSKLAPGIDVLGDGGMVLAPPSSKPKGSYTWLHMLPVAEAPYWLMMLVMQPRRRLHRTGELVVGQKQPQVHPALVAACVRQIPNTDATKWGDWNNIGMAIWTATGGSAEGFDIFREFSKKNVAMYDAFDTGDKWSRITGGPPRDIGFGTLVYLADKANPGWWCTYDDQVIAAMAAANEASHD